MVRVLNNNIALEILEEEIDKDDQKEIEVITKEGKGSRGNLQKGKVLGLGANVHRPIYEGDLIIVPKYSGYEVTQDDKTIVIIQENEVLAKEV